MKSLFRILSLATAATLVMALSACGEKAVSSSVASQTPSSTSSSESVAVSSLPASSNLAENSSGNESAPAKTATANTELSDDIYSQQVEIDGVVYTFPVENIQPFLDNGWTTDKPLDFSLPAQTTTSGYSFKNSDGHVIVLSFCNVTDTTQEAMNCSVYSLSFSTYAAGKGASVILPKGITMGSSYDEIIAAYGAADKESPYSVVLELRYGKKSYNYINLNMDPEEKLVNDIYISFTDPAA